MSFLLTLTFKQNIYVQLVDFLFLAGFFIGTLIPALAILNKKFEITATIIAFAILLCCAVINQSLWQIYLPSMIMQIVTVILLGIRRSDITPKEFRFGYANLVFFVAIPNLILLFETMAIPTAEIEFSFSTLSFALFPLAVATLMIFMPRIGALTLFLFGLVLFVLNWIYPEPYVVYINFYSSFCIAVGYGITIRRLQRAQE